MHSLIFVIMKDLCADSPSITILTECALRLTKDGDKVNIVIADFTLFTFLQSFVLD